MIKAGLTGSIGMGKTTTAQMFRDEGIPVYDADAAVHELYEGKAVQLIEDAFPETTREGKVDRALLGKQVLNNPQALQKLESIIHPMVHEVEKEFLANSEARGEGLVILDIPLLFETGGENRVDVVIVVSASLEEQRKRVLQREGMTEEKFQNILSRQVPDKEKRERADYIIDTGMGLDHAREQVKKIIGDLKQKAV